ncbi:10940_t:CDS:2 [Cetraspora pellucida]|uniref:10940_t:CDS:1 n=1 Tax=Cetraspora pellucida TaxID=1433469 RepID=A0ACA9K501_9GLOM|nr:10940_t:CDS:2 [Cetraspora pellucida]
MSFNNNSEHLQVFIPIFEQTFKCASRVVVHYDVYDEKKD